LRTGRKSSRPSKPSCGSTSPGGGYGGFDEEKLALTAVVRIDIETMTGKQDLGKPEEWEAVQRIIEDAPEPAALLERS
jgi:hypothetical protein